MLKCSQGQLNAVGVKFLFLPNLDELMAELLGYSHLNATSVFEKFICNSGQIRISEDAINVTMKKKRHLPILLKALEPFQNEPITWMGNRQLSFMADSSS